MHIKTKDQKNIPFCDNIGIVARRVFVHGNKYLFVFFFCLLNTFVVFSCSVKPFPNTDLERDTISRIYPVVSVPSDIVAPEKQARYVLSHFWDGFDFDHGDEYLDDIDNLNQCFKDFIALSLSLPKEIALPELLTPINRSKGKLFKYFEWAYAQNLLEDFSSEKSELYYLAVAEWLLSSPQVDFAMRERLLDVQKMLQKNQPGTEAKDFEFVSLGGKHYRLSDFRGTPVILVFFSPDCESCKKLTKEISEDSFLQKNISLKKIHLLYISLDKYEGEKEDWYKSTPSGAVSGYDEFSTILNHSLYDIARSPLIYLIDRKGYVKNRNTTLEEIKKTLK